MQKHIGFIHLIKTAGYSCKGLKAACGESAFRQELTLFVLMVPLAFWIGDNSLEIALLIGSTLLILLAELINTALEAVVDHIGTEDHELSGKTKDLGFAAVFVSLIIFGLVWLGVLLN